MTPLEKAPTCLIVVALALIDEAGRVLMQRRPEHRAHGGLWEFPGGKVEPGEAPAAALVRECAEELGIALAEANLAPLSFAEGTLGEGSRPILLLLYACHQRVGEPVCEPGALLQWTQPEDLAALPMPPLDVPLAAALVTYLKNAAIGLANPGTRF
ncbi:MAG: (deoxy)nucleoside triphosphate pyrophosphohydrolase [Novosphingobium sp.]